MVHNDEPPLVQIFEPDGNVTLPVGGLLKIVGEARDDVGVKSIALLAQVVGGPENCTPAPPQRGKAPPFDRRVLEDSELPRLPRPEQVAIGGWREDRPAARSRGGRSAGGRRRLRPAAARWVEARWGKGGRTSGRESAPRRQDQPGPMDEKKAQEDRQKAEQDRKQHEAEQDAARKKEDEARQEDRRQAEEKERTRQEDGKKPW